MKKAQIRNIITKLHFCLLGFALFNFALKSTVEISLNYRLAYIIILLIYGSGIVLFFWNLKPFKRLIFYYSVYFITPILTLLFWMFGGIFLAVLTSIALHPIFPNETITKNDKIVIHSKFQGFLGACCPYQVNETKFWLLEKKLTEINIHEEIDFNDILITTTNEKTELNIKHKKYNDELQRYVETDTIIEIKTK